MFCFVIACIRVFLVCVFALRCVFSLLCLSTCFCFLCFLVCLSLCLPCLFPSVFLFNGVGLLCSAEFSLANLRVNSVSGISVCS